MNKKTFWVTSGVIIGVIVIAVFITHRMDMRRDNSSKSNLPQTSQNIKSTPPESNQGSVMGHIEITKNRLFTPPQITVHKGEAVVWTNNDNTDHTVTDDLSNVGGPKSSNIAPGATYSFTFNKSGSFQYHCEFHHEMRGTIVVQ